MCRNRMGDRVTVTADRPPEPCHPEYRHIVYPVHDGLSRVSRRRTERNKRRIYGSS